MNIFNLIKKTFREVIENPSITMILVLYLILFTLLLKDFNSVSGIPDILKIISVFLVSLCFLSGWLQIFKHINSQENNDDKNYFPIFIEGVGKNILPFFCGLMFYSTLIFIVAILAIKFAHNTFGSLDFLLKDFAALSQDNNSLIEYFNNLGEDKKFIISSWQLTFIVVSTIFEFTLLFYFPALLYEEKYNAFLKPFVAIKNAICFTFKNFFPSLFLYSAIYATYVFLSIIKVLVSTNTILSAICLFIHIYFISFAIMLIFSYYGQKNNSNNGCDSIGENENIDRASEEN
ncbi:hypothetical protein IJ425_05635 [bacterium]|nr:hypothetical protein [bacterium]